MANVLDVASYILEKKGSMSAMKLQKLVYYSQAWVLAWTETPLFDEEIQAWINGPVVRSLYDAHKGQYRVASGFFKGDPNKLHLDQKELIDTVLEFYGDKDPQWLSELTHMESPWKDARLGLADNERGENQITKEVMLEYYSSL